MTLREGSWDRWEVRLQIRLQKFAILNYQNQSYKERELKKKKSKSTQWV